MYQVILTIGFCKYTDEDDTTCDCKEADQTMEHLLECPLLRQTCSLDDLMVYNDVAKECVRQWIGLVKRHDKKKTKSFNICSMLYNDHIALNYTGHFVYSTLNIGYWILNIYIIILKYICIIVVVYPLP